MTRNLLAACTALLALSSQSLAADMGRPYSRPMPPPTTVYVAPFSWTGFYLGVNGGYGWGKADITNPTASFTTGTTNGWMFGGTAGYNLQAGNFVFGVEGDIDYALIKGHATNATTCGTGTCEVKDTWFATARGRIGYAFDRWMPFLTGGAAFAGLKVLPATGASSTAPPLDGRSAAASNTPFSRPGRSRPNISTPISAVRPAKPPFAACRPTSNPKSMLCAPV